MNRPRNFPNLAPSKPWRNAWAALCLLACAGPLLAAAPPKRARPPKFDKTVSDAFFPDAREKLQGARPQRAATKPEVANVPAPATPQTPLSPGSDASGSPNGSFAWSKLIAAETVEDEIKSQQIKLSETVQTPTAFKGGAYRDARTHLGVLAALFAIDAQYDGEIRWHRQAAGARDLLARAGFNCKVGTDNSFKEAKLRADELAGLVRGGSWDLPPATEQAEWPRIVDRSLLMKRLESAHQGGLAVWTANSNDFSRSATKVAHEAEIVAALAHIISQEGYEFADDETYLEYARDMQTQALATRAAVESGNYEQARQAVGELGKACSACHEGYRN